MNNSSLGSNWEHYLEAFRAYSEWVEHKFPDALRNHEGSNPELYKPLEDISVAEENKRLAVDGYLALYADLLGFSDEIGETGFDPLPDFYGAALVSAANYPLVQVFLLSDSCLAFAPVKEVDSFLDFVFSIFGGWLADGMLPRCIIGYGSFVERRPFREETPPNFFGTQVTGTSLVDAANIEKRRRPLGARILLSDSALEYVPDRFSFARDADGNAELLPVIPKQFSIHYSLYYILCLRTQSPGTRAFNHYIWSAASRMIDGGELVQKVALKLARRYFSEEKFGEIEAEILTVLEKYKLGKDD